MTIGNVSLKKILREDPKALSAAIAWLAGYTRYDVVKMFNIDVDVLRDYGIILDEFGEYMIVQGLKYKRYDKESIEKFIRSFMLDPLEIFLTLCRTISKDEAKILTYAADFVKRYGRFSLYGISDYIRCVERPENVNVEFKVLLTLQKYMLYMCDRSHKCIEYSWTQDLVENIRKMFGTLFNLPTDEDILRELENFLKRNMSSGLEILAALYSMCTGTIDQFQSFHKCRIQDVLKDVSEIRYVYYNGFVNPLALDLIVKVVREDIIEKIVLKISKEVGEILNTYDELHYLTYVTEKIVIRVPKMYYLSPIFWAKPGAINIVYRIPKNLSSYMSTYGTYFEKGFLVVAQGSDILKIFAFPGHDDTVKEKLRNICDVVEV